MDKQLSECNTISQCCLWQRWSCHEACFITVFIFYLWMHPQPRSLCQEVVSLLFSFLLILCLYFIFILLYIHRLNKCSVPVLQFGINIHKSINLVGPKCLWKQNTFDRNQQGPPRYIKMTSECRYDAYYGSLSIVNSFEFYVRFNVG